MRHSLLDLIDMYRIPDGVLDISWAREGDYHEAVAAKSSILGLPHTMEKRLRIPGNHSTLVKFTTQWAPGYQSVVEELRRIFQLDCKST